MSGRENIAMSDIDLQVTDRTSASEEQIDAGLRDIQVSNVYVGKRNFIHQLMDVALLMANVSQLKALLSLDSSDKYYILLFVFISTSIVLQVMFTITMLAIWSIEKKLEDHSLETPPRECPGDHTKKTLAQRLDKLGNILVLLIIVSNVFITGFGVEAHGLTKSPQNNAIPVPLNPQLSNNSLRVN